MNPALPLLDRLAQLQPDLAPRRFGVVSACDGGLLEVCGLALPIGAQCRVAHGRGNLSAEAIGFRNGHTLMMLLGDPVLLRPGARVRPQGKPGMLPVGAAFLGRAVDGEGHPIDGGPPITTRDDWPVGGVRAGALDRAPVRYPFDVGVRALNALTTFGVGQRIGIMAGSGVGKSVLLDMIAHGAEAEVVVVALIGERAREVSDFVERHMQGPKRAHSVIVAVPADHAPNLRIRGAMLANGIAEHFRKQGRRVLLIMDSLTRVAHAAREIGLLLGEPGIGKTHFGKRLSQLLSTGFGFISMSSMTAGWILSGSSSQWKNAKPGKVFDTMLNGDYANPVMVVDEIDKAGGDGQYDPLGALYSLLEQDTASEFIDEFVEIPINASSVVWIATANDASRIPDPILNRVNVYEIEPPDHDGARRIAQALYSEIRNSHDWGRSFPEAPATPALEALSQFSPREMRRVLVNGFGNAKLDGRDEMLATDITENRAPKKQRIGF